MKMELGTVKLLIGAKNAGGQVLHENVGTVIEGDLGGTTGPSDFDITFLVCICFGK